MQLTLNSASKGSSDRSVGPTQHRTAPSFHGVPSWFCRLRSLSKPILTKLRRSYIQTTLSSDVLSSESIRKSSWITSLLPMALAVSAGSLALQSHYNDSASFCDAPNLDQTGTLGVITEVALRLQKIPQHSVVAMCNFPTVKDAADVAIATMLSGIQGGALDKVQVRAINVANGKTLPEVPTLLFEFIGTEDPEAKKELWKRILKQKRNFGSTIIAHAGDGNFDTIVLFDPNIEEQQRDAERLNHFMVHTALAMEGTSTGEHGDGTVKMKYLEKELGIEALQTMKKIQVALDPNNIMNPGKLIPPHVCL